MTFKYVCNGFASVPYSVTINDFGEAAKIFAQQISDCYDKDCNTTIRETSKAGMREAGSTYYRVEVFTKSGDRKSQETLLISVERVQPIGELLKEAIARDGLTIYRAAQIVCAETEEPLATVHRRISCYVAPEPPKTIQQFEKVCRELGYELTLTKP